MNRAILIGNLAGEPESRTTASGVTTCTFRLAVQRRFANADGKREADFLQIVTWRQTAENCAKYLSKGRKVAVEGSIQTRTYEAQDGSKRHVVEVVADNVEILTPRDKGQEAPQEAQDGFTPVDDTDELPF